MKSQIMTGWVCIWANTGSHERSEFVLVDPSGSQEPMGVVVNAYKGDGYGAIDECDEMEEIRVPLDRFTYQDGVLSDNPHHPMMAHWAADSLNEVAFCCGTDAAELIRCLCSEDPLRRFCGYEALASYFGWHEFDSYPNWYSDRRDRKLIRRAMARWENQAAALRCARAAGMSCSNDAITLAVIADWLVDTGNYYARHADLLRVE